MRIGKNENNNFFLLHVDIRYSLKNKQFLFAKKKL